METQVDVEIVIKSLKDQIGNMAQEIAVLNAMIVALQQPATPVTTTAVTDKPDVVGTQGIK